MSSLTCQHQGAFTVEGLYWCVENCWLYCFFRLVYHFYPLLMSEKAYFFKFLSCLTLHQFFIICTQSVPLPFVFSMLPWNVTAVVVELCKQLSVYMVLFHAPFWQFVLSRSKHCSIFCSFYGWTGRQLWWRSDWKLYGWMDRQLWWRSGWKLSAFLTCPFTWMTNSACYVRKHWHKFISVLDPS